MNHLVNAFNTGIVQTENGANARAGTGSAVLNLFAQIAAQKAADARMFRDAWAENPELTAKCLFWARDIRGGQGRRDVFRQYFALMQGVLSHAQAHNLMGLIPEYGRWDDVLYVNNMEVASDLIKNQLLADKDEAHPSLLAKWMPSENTSSPTTVAMARAIRKALGMSSRQYRKMLSNLRQRISLVEHRMTQNEWTGIEYSHVPSQAMLKYRKAFSRHDADGFVSFLADVKSGKKVIKSGTLYPDQLVSKYLGYACYSGSAVDEVVEEQWKALPNYFKEPENSIVVADVSGSMYGKPIEISISLALYCAERNTGAFHNRFITFSATPELQEVRGHTLYEKVSNLSRAGWDMNTNVAAVFERILGYAIHNRVKPQDMVKRIFIVSDMEFDACGGTQFHETLFEGIKAKFQRYGFVAPSVVFWNVNARNKQFPVEQNAAGVQLVSGSSPSIIKDLLGNEMKTPYQLMELVLQSDRYAAVKL